MKFKKKTKPLEHPELTPDREDLTSLSWFPGHMARALKEVRESLKKVHLVVELLDARAPLATKNPELHQAIANKKHLIILNKANLVGPEDQNLWQSWFDRQQQKIVWLNSFDQSSLEQLRNELLELANKDRTTEEKRSTKLMIVGLPNTGKSTLINHLSGKKNARVQDKPGLTQRQQWVSLTGELELLDTPGIMRPKIENEEQTLILAAINAIKESMVDMEDIAFYLLKKILLQTPELIEQQYKISLEDKDALNTYQAIATRLGHLKKGGELELMRTAKVIIQDFRDGKLGLFALEKPPRK
jgi:ribosome biogenesis GTPase A